MKAKNTKTSGGKHTQDIGMGAAEEVPTVFERGHSKVSQSEAKICGKKSRRKSTAKDELRILAETDNCENGELGDLLRNEGLYWANLTVWQCQRENGVLNALTLKNRGQSAKESDPYATRLIQFKIENQQLQQKLTKLEMIMEAQKNACDFGEV